MMMMTSYEAPGYGATASPGYLDPYQHQLSQHQYAWQFAGLGYQRLQQQQQHLQQQQKFDQQFDQQRLQQPAPSQTVVNVGQHYYGNCTASVICVGASCSNTVPIMPPTVGNGAINVVIWTFRSSALSFTGAKSP